jgi:type II secretory pathway pseudopilin PulG
VRRGRVEFRLVDALMVAVGATIIAAVAIPLIEKGTDYAKQTTLQENLRVLREQIELYRIQHGGSLPAVEDGRMPQLTSATNAQGGTGEPGRKFPFGPYLRGGVPVNPKTGRSLVTPLTDFPPTAPSGNGGWLYHPATGKIVPDLEDHLGD